MRVFPHWYTGQNYTEPAQRSAPILVRGEGGAADGDPPNPMAALSGYKWRGVGKGMERVKRGCLSIPADNLADLSAAADVSSAVAGLSLRELCHDLIEPTATIRWLVRAAEAESGQDLRNRLGAIAIAAGQIAAICEHILDGPQRYAGVRLDLIAADAVATAQVRYAGLIDVVSQPVTALAQPGDVVRILYNMLTNACRAAGPSGRVRVLVDEADGQARMT